MHCACRPLLLACLALCPALTACAPFPLSDNPGSEVAQGAPWPVLLPLDQLLVQQGEVAITAESNAGLLARAEVLRARAARLRARQVGG